ncbi:MAG: hypothetical protein KGL95_03960, partial [Patescibacteria group bacterium]|nr:hypothetical protein [Patescibacteria group bacterium]
TYTPVSPIVFSENFDEATPPTSNGWTISGSGPYANSASIQQYTTDLFGQPAPSPPYWGGVGVRVFEDPNCNSEYDIATKSFNVSQPGNYTVSASIAAPVSTIIPQLYVDGNLVFNEYDESNTNIRSDSKIISLSAGTHYVEIVMNSDFACNGLFVTYFDNILIKQTSDPDPSYRSGGPLFTIQLGQNSVNMTSGSSTVIPLDVTWNNGSSTEPVSATFLGNTTSVIPAITSVSNTTSSEMFNVTLNVPSGTQSGGYDVGVKVAGPDGDYRIAGIFVRVQ